MESKSTAPADLGNKRSDMVLGEDLQSQFDQFDNGFDEVDQDDLKQAFLKVAQDGGLTNPQKEGHIPGLKPGDIYNSRSNKIYGRNVKIIPLTFFKRWNEWSKQSSNEKGKLVNSFTRKQLDEIREVCTKDGFNLRSPEGNVIQETWYFPVILPEHPEDGIVMLSFKSTTMKTGKDFLSIATSQTINRAGKVEQAKMFYFQYNLMSGYEDKGEYDWWAFKSVSLFSAITSEMAAYVKPALVSASEIQKRVMEFESVPEESEDYIKSEPKFT